MMIRGRWIVTAVVVCVCASLVAGCRTKGAGKRGDAGLGSTKLTDENGLPPIGAEWGEDRRDTSVKFENVLFDLDSAKIKDSERSKIETVAQYLKSNPSRRAAIEGNCDERGTAEYNMALGDRRALAVRAYIIGLGIDAGRLLARSFGKEKPIDPGHNESAWRLNRRDEFAVYR